MKGYIKGESTELELNKINAAKSTRMRINGISHHFFSRQANDRHSFKRRHIIGRFYKQQKSLLQGTHLNEKLHQLILDLA